MGFFRGKTTPRITPLSENATYGEYPEDWPEDMRIVQACRHFEIMNDSAELISKTLNTKTFFSRYNEALKEADILIKLCKNHKYGILAANLRDSLLSARVQIINNFLYRCKNAGKLHLEKDNIFSFRSEMPDECFAIFQELLGCHTDEGNDKEYVFYSVCFNENDKSYYYLSNNENINCGDYVVVPIGNKYHATKVGRVVRVETFKKNEAPFPVDSLKYIVDINAIL